MSVEFDIDKIKEDVSEWWDQYLKDNGIDKKLLLFVIDLDESMKSNLVEIVDVVISQIMLQRNYEGESALKPKQDGEDNE